jgi:hypothetical protein
VGVIVVMRLLERLARPGPTWAVGLLFAALVTAGMVVPTLWDRPAVTLPAGVALAVGVLLLVATWLPRYGLIRFAARDRIVDPRTAQEPFKTPRWANEPFRATAHDCA